MLKLLRRLPHSQELSQVDRKVMKRREGHPRGMSGKYPPQYKLKNSEISFVNGCCKAIAVTTNKKKCRLERNALRALMNIFERNDGGFTLHS